MRTNIELNDELLAQVQALGHFDTKKAAVHAALSDYLNTLKRQQLLALRGQMPWVGDLNALRGGRMGMAAAVGDTDSDGGTVPRVD